VQRSRIDSSRLEILDFNHTSTRAEVCTQSQLVATKALHWKASSCQVHLNPIPTDLAPQLPVHSPIQLSAGSKPHPPLKLVKSGGLS
jgi:hypothetical protein